ncbi:MAG: hypothetical protein U0175_30855 [Caldilineaceae bacterium]
MNYQAMVFVRRSAAYHIGHVGWAFAQGEGIFSVGSVENHHGGLITDASHMGFWRLTTDNPIAPMFERHYDEVKIIEVEQADPFTAQGVVNWVSKQAYEAIGRNCMDDTYDVLQAYGVSNLPLPVRHWEPNYWFDAIPETPYQLSDASSLTEAMKGKHALTLNASGQNSIRQQPVSPPATPVTPAWRSATEPQSHHFHAALHAAKRMPVHRRLHLRVASLALSILPFHT